MPISERRKVQRGGKDATCPKVLSRPAGEVKKDLVQTLVQCLTTVLQSLSMCIEHLETFLVGGF